MRIAAIALATAAFAFAGAPAWANLLDNPGWDDATASPWQHWGTGSWNQSTSQYVSSPNSYASSSEPADGNIWQNVAVGKLPAVSTSYYAEVRHRDDGPYRYFGMYVYGIKTAVGAGGTYLPGGSVGTDYDVLYTSLGPGMGFATNSWGTAQGTSFNVDSTTYPQGLRFRLEYDLDAGAATYAAFDDAKIVPEPVTLGLLGLGVLGLLRRRRR